MLKKILVLSDGKPGHKKQALSLLEILKSRYQAEAKIVDLQIGNPFVKALFELSVFLFRGIVPASFISFPSGLFKQALKGWRPDIIISCSSLAGFASAGTYPADKHIKRFHILKPSFLPFAWFNKVFIPYHDDLSGPNVINFEGALYVPDAKELNDAAGKVRDEFDIQDGLKQRISLFLGGENKSFYFPGQKIEALFDAVKKLVKDRGAEALVTTSRRTARQIEKLVKDIGALPWCAACVIANEKNYPFVTPGFLALSDAVIITSDSISMVWEAISFKKRVWVVNLPVKRSGAHQRFLARMYERKWAQALSDDLGGVFDAPVPAKDIDDYFSGLTEQILAAV